MSEGRALITHLKQHILSRLSAEADCQPDAVGLGNVEVERLCELELHLDSQDHYLTYSLLCSLIKDGLVERIKWAKQPEAP